jgi:hypothetical protein
MTDQVTPAFDKAAAAVAGKLVQDAATQEETRFNNLNNRGIALVSASSLVTALIGLFGKDLTGTAYASVRQVVATLLLITVAALITSVGIIIIGVLLPGGRVAFGDNLVTRGEAALKTGEDVSLVQWSEYTRVLDVLQKRNAGKAKAINAAYWVFGLALVFGTMAVGAVIVFALTLG